METVNERIALAEENLIKVSEDLSSKADLVLDNTFSGEQVFSNDVTFGKTIYLNNVEDPDMSTTLDGSSLYTTNVTTFTINDNDLTFTDGEIVIGDKILTFDGEDEVIPANSVTDEARVFARVAQESATVAEASMETAVASASAASISETNAANSATSAEVSATAVSEAKDSIANCDEHWRAYYKVQTNLNGYLKGSQITTFTYDLPKLVNGENMFAESRKLEVFEGSLQALEKGGYMFHYCTELKEFSTDSLDKLTNAAVFLYGTKIEEFNYNLPAVTSLWRSFAWTPNLRAVRCGELSLLTSATETFNHAESLEIFDGTLPALSSAATMFYACKLNKESALRVLTSIPAYESGSHPITVGIHVDNQTDEEVLAAIEGARGRGWTVTVQWNGKATAATFALRPTPLLPVYAKRAQDEQGDYKDSAGGRWIVDWGHIVASPDSKTPLELGYEQFNSLEAALTEWGITEYIEIPNEEQINNN